jgi:hypothetical protein
VPDQFRDEALGDGKVDAALSCFTWGRRRRSTSPFGGGMRFADERCARGGGDAQVFPGACSQVFPPLPVWDRRATRLMVYSAFLVSSTHTAADVVYKAIKAINENKPILVAASPAMNSFDPSAMSEESIVPYHPGAEKFLKEVGQWPPKKR